MNPVKCTLLDLDIDFIDYASNLISNPAGGLEQYKKIVFICPDKRPILSIKKQNIKANNINININQNLKRTFFTIENFIKFTAYKFNGKIPVLLSRVEFELKILRLIKKIDSLYKKLGGSDDKVFNWAKKIAVLFDEIDSQSPDKISNIQYADVPKEADLILTYLKDLYGIYSMEFERENCAFTGRILKIASEASGSSDFKNYFDGALFIFAGMTLLSGNEKRILKNIGTFAGINYILQTDLKCRDGIKFGTSRCRHYSFDNFSVIDGVAAELKEIFNERLVIEKLYGKYEEKGEYSMTDAAAGAGGKPGIDGTHGERKKSGFPTLHFYEFDGFHKEAYFIAQNLNNINMPVNTPDNFTVMSSIGVIVPELKTINPLIRYLENFNVPFNFNAGIYFKYTDFGIFLKTLFDLLTDLERNRKETGRFLSGTAGILKLIGIKSIISLMEDKINFKGFAGKIIKNGSAVFEFDEIDGFFVKLIKPFLIKDDMHPIYSALCGIYALMDEKKLINNEYDYYRVKASIDYFYRQLHKAKTIFENPEPPLFFAARILNDFISDLKIPVKINNLSGKKNADGMPGTSGVMDISDARETSLIGLLESRLLSFDELFIADVNYGILPSYAYADPLMPEEVKIQLGIPKSKEREDFIKYNFFRLIYSSDSVHIMYKIGGSADERYDVSPFVEQLLLMEEARRLNFNGGLKGDNYDNYNKSVIESFTGRISAVKKKFYFLKRDDLIKTHYGDFERKGGYFSPSELDVYLNCPYKHYLRYIKKIKGVSALEDNFRADIIGSYIHNIFQFNFKKYLGCQIDHRIYFEKIFPSIVREVNLLPDLSHDYFNGTDKVSAASYFKSLSDFNLDAAKYIITSRIENFFNLEKKNFRCFTLKEVESELKYDETNSNAHNINTGQRFICAPAFLKTVFGPVRIRGIADRIDLIKGMPDGVSTYTSGVCAGIDNPKEESECASKSLEADSGDSGYSGDVIRIIDYKTGYSAPAPKEKQIEELLRDITNGGNGNKLDDESLMNLKSVLGSAQLPAYIIMADDKYNKGKEKNSKNIEACLYMIGVPDEKDYVKKIRGGELNLEYYRQSIGYIIRHMKGSEFIYAFKTKQCEYCDYNIMCRYA